MADSANVRFDANIPALGEILPRSRGSVTARGTLTGTPERVHAPQEGDHVRGGARRSLRDGAGQRPHVVHASPPT